MSLNVEPLFTPFNIRNLTLRNRFVMPPMQRGMADNGRPTLEMADLYRRSAEGGTGLIIAESTAPAHPSGYWKPEFCRLDQGTMDGWRRCVDAAKGAGASFFIQLWHPGSIRVIPDGEPAASQDTLSPSGLMAADRPNGRAMTRQELEDVKDSYVGAAELAKASGADGVEIHACHGYLLDQFLWSGTNRRQDEYGGSDAASRARYPAEIIAAIRAAIGPDFPISIRLSQFKEIDYGASVCETADEFARLLATLRQAGVDIFHISTRRFYEPAWPDSPLTLAGWAKASTNAAVITVGSVGLSTDVFDNLFDSNDPQPDVERSLRQLCEKFFNNEFDLVSVGRSIIADPQWVNKIRAGAFDQIPLFRRAMLGGAIEEISESMAEELRKSGK